MDDKCCEWCGTTASYDAEKCPICRQPFDLVIGPPAGSTLPGPTPATAPTAPASPASAVSPPTPSVRPAKATKGRRGSTRVLDKPVITDDAPLSDDLEAPAAAVPFPRTAAEKVDHEHRVVSPDDGGHDDGHDGDPFRESIALDNRATIDQVPDDGIDPTLRELAAHLDRRDVRRRSTKSKSTKKHHQRRRGLRLAILGVLAVVALTMAAIGARELLPSDRVADAVRNYYGADTCRQAIDLVSSDSAPIFRVCEEKDAGRDIADIEVSEVKVDGDEATAQVRLRETVDGTSRIQSFEQELVKEDGDWRLFLSSDS